MQNISVIAQLRFKKPTDQTGTVIIRAFLNRSPVRAVSTGLKVMATHWNARDRKVRDGAPNASLINSVIQLKLQSIQGEILKRELAGAAVDKISLREITGGGEKPNFEYYAYKMLAEKTMIDGNPYTPDTRRRYESEIVRILQFRNGLTLEQITPGFLAQYKLWMQTTYLKKDKAPLHSNSIWKALSFVRSVWMYAEKNHQVSAANNPFGTFKVGKWKQSMEIIKYLELEDLDAIEKMLLEKEKHLPLVTLQVGWRFLCMCVFGLRISDARLLNESFVSTGGAIEFIPYKTRRNGNTATIHIVSERQQRYLAKTLALSIPDKKINNFRGLFNDQLKIIQLLAGVELHITSHVGRHTMGSFLTDGSIDDKAAKRILGVRTPDVLKTYMHLKDKKLLLETEKLTEVLK